MFLHIQDLPDVSSIRFLAGIITVQRGRVKARRPCSIRRRMAIDQGQKARVAILFSGSATDRPPFACVSQSHGHILQRVSAEQPEQSDPGIAPSQGATKWWWVCAIRIGTRIWASWPVPERRRRAA